MATWQDLKPSSRFYLERYKFPDLPVPELSLLAKPLEKCKVMLITTAGLHLKNDPPFSQSFKDSDCSFRLLPKSASLDDLRISHISGDFEQQGALEDLNVVYPMERMKELVARGEVGSISDTNFSFMGSLPDTTDLTEIYAPQVAAAARGECVDIALLTPV